MNETNQEQNKSGTKQIRNKTAQTRPNMINKNNSYKRRDAYFFSGDIKF